MATPKRAVVLRLAELERYPTTYARYEITLPFSDPTDPYLVSLACSCPTVVNRFRHECTSYAKNKANAIKQTEKRWIWFSEARKLDDRLNRRLGTLGYLPWDIREMIWCMAIDEYKVLFWGKWHWAWVDEGLLRSPLDFKRDPECDESRPNDEISGLDIFDLCSYLGLSSFGDGTMDLRLASPQVKIELESAFIFRNAFRFFCPILMDHFLNQLSAHHRPLLRSINLMLFGCWDSCDPDTGSITSDCRAWVAVIERLPATIQFVTLDIGTYRMPCGMQYNHSYDIKMIVALLEVMTKKVQRQAPRAKISVPALKDYWCDSDKELLQIMFDELEPFSEDFKKWSDQSRKNAME